MVTSSTFNQPRLEHIAIWNRSIDKAVKFFEDALEWKRHPIEFGVDDDNATFGGMDLAFVDANGIWLELIEPTTEGPGMDLLKTKGEGSLVELCFEIDDMDKKVTEFRDRGIELRDMNDKPMSKGGLLQEWVIDNGVRRLGDERLAYIPSELAHGTTVEMFWEYDNGVLLLRDRISAEIKSTAKSTPRVSSVVVFGQEVEKATSVYTKVMDLPRSSYSTGLPREWMGITPATKHSWIRANHDGFFVEVVSPPTTEAATHLLTDPKFGEGCILELGVEVADLAAFHDKLLAKGYRLTGGDGTPLPDSQKYVSSPSSDKFAYFDRDQSEGMRIMLIERGAAEKSIFTQREL